MNNKKKGWIKFAFKTGVPAQVVARTKGVLLCQLNIKYLGLKYISNRVLQNIFLPPDQMFIMKKNFLILWKVQGNLTFKCYGYTDELSQVTKMRKHAIYPKKDPYKEILLGIKYMTVSLGYK